MKPRTTRGRVARWQAGRISRIVVRGATEADRAAVLSLAPRLAEGVAPWRDQERAVAAGRRWLADSLDASARGEGTLLVAAESPACAVVGAVSVRPTVHFTGEHDGYAGELVVAERSARRGIGRRLIEAASAWARDRGLANLSPHTGAYNVNARAFYAALGFAEEEVRLTLRL